jgi:hypothetical protein
MRDPSIAVEIVLSRSDPRSAELGSGEVGAPAMIDSTPYLPSRHAAGINKQTIEHLFPSDVICHIHPVYYFNKVA